MAVQIIPSRKRDAFYIYAYKGGPLIRKHEGPRKPVLTARDHKAISDALEARNAEPEHLFVHVIREWQRSEEWKSLEPSTRKVWQGHVDRIEAKWGAYPYSVWNDPRMAEKVVKWRNERKANPRTADIGVTVLRALLKWAKLCGFVHLNAALDIPQLYKGADREEIIWLSEDIAAFEKVAIAEERPHLIDGLRLAALTGMRRADLVTLTFAHVGEFSVAKTALKKSRGKRRKATIPMTDELEAFLAEMRTRPRAEGVETILVNSFGRPWTGDGFGGSFNRIRDLADIVHTDEDGTKRKKHLHDVRGTFCTLLLAECGLTDEEAAPILAWSKERVGRIRRVYVDDARVVVAIGKRIAAGSIANRGANQ